MRALPAALLAHAPPSVLAHAPPSALDPVLAGAFASGALQRPDGHHGTTDAGVSR
jgi:hypothetical protein